VALVQHVSAAAGSRRPRGSVVTLRVGCRCPIGSPAVPKGTLPRYTIPTFAGDTIAAARRWIVDKTLFLTEHIGELRAGDANSLYKNYRITKQDPHAGTALSLGVMVHDLAGTPGFKPTPLIVWAHQTRDSRS
jgi:hypothetical protein